MAQGDSTITAPLDSPDATAMLTACQTLGAQVLHQSPECIQIRGVGGRPQIPRDIIHSGNSGQVLRFISAVASLSPDYTVITGDSSVRSQRPILPLMEGLRGLGAFCAANEGHPPLIVRGPIQPGITTLEGTDSQPVSALLIACSLLQGTSEIHVRSPGELPWIGLTLDWLQRLGVQVENHGFTRFLVHGTGGFPGFSYQVPADFSSLTYPVVAAILGNRPLTVENVDWQDSQGDKHVLTWLQDMGAHLTIDVANRRIQVSPGSQLRGCSIDVNPCIDALPLLAVVACFATGKMRLYNAAIARKKESDRLATISQELRKMGALIEESGEDTLEITPRPLHGACLDSHRDHRIAMSLCVAALAAQGPSRLEGCEWVDKSYARFFSDFTALGAHLIQEGTPC